MPLNSSINAIKKKWKVGEVITAEKLNAMVRATIRGIVGVNGIKVDNYGDQVIISLSRRRIIPRGSAVDESVRVGTGVPTFTPSDTGPYLYVDIEPTNPESSEVSTDLYFWFGDDVTADLQGWHILIEINEGNGVLKESGPTPSTTPGEQDPYITITETVPSPGLGAGFWNWDAQAAEWLILSHFK